MKQKLLASAMALAMVLSLTPVTALAAEGEDVSSIAGVSVSYGTQTWATDGSGNLEVTVSNDSDVTDFDVEVTLAEGAAFTPTEHASGDLYVESATTNAATLKFDIVVDVVDIKDDMFALNLTSEDGSVWTGGFTEAEGLKVGVLASYLAGQVITIREGALGADSAAQTMAVNRDAAESTLLLLAPGTTVYTVNYVVDGQTITWLLPAGADLETPYVELSDGESIAWYMDAGFNNDLEDDATVTGNTTLYAQITGGTTDPTDNFYTALTTGQPATIGDLDDWEIFVEYADQAVAGQLITLGDNINCNGATYDSLTFAGNFNGNGKTISNATFEATSDTPSGESCSGMFATLGHGQIVANLTLDNIDVEYAGEYAGALAGMVDGWSNDRALVQNVQVRNSSVSGRSAGGVAGFIRNADVIYCSSTGTTITGLANGGGVVGINNAHVEYCYSTSTPTALTFLGGSVGGVISKNVRGGNNNYCWAYMQVVGAEEDGPGQNLNSLEANANMSYETFYNNGFTQYCWTMSDNGPAEFDPDEVSYNFGSNS